MTDNQVIEIITLCQSNALKPDGKIGEELIDDVRKMLEPTIQGPSLEELNKSVKDMLERHIGPGTEPPAPAQGVEEGAKLYAEQNIVRNPREYDTDFDLLTVYEEAFIAGSRWQQGQGDDRGLTITTGDGSVIPTVPVHEDIVAYGKKCFYKGFEKAKKDDANLFTAWREEAPYIPLPPQPPTIGARWVRGTPPNDNLYHIKWGSELQFMGTGFFDGQRWHTHGGTNILIKGAQVEWLDESTCTFPTREQAEQWAVNEFVVKLSNKTPVLAALAMYDWIASKFSVPTA